MPTASYVLAAALGSASHAASAARSFALWEGVKQARLAQSYGHAVLAESESWICRLLQSLRELPKNKFSMLVTLLTSKARGWSKPLH